MKHNLKLPDGTIKAVECKLGSGIFDKHGKEIFEGDRVTNGRHKFPVKFINGALYIFDESKGEGYDINPHFTQGFEVVGHVDD